jgi:hypothetical protein
MGTRAVYTFIDTDGRYSVFKHWDGYPTGACRFITNALTLAWPIPRFEADEFAAAFVAANKKQAGNIRLTDGPEAHGDIEYTYEITCRHGRLQVRISKVHYSGSDYNQIQYRQLFDGLLEDAQQFAADYESH